jgi:hypothetical protein
MAKPWKCIWEKGKANRAQKKTHILNMEKNMRKINETQ